MGEFNWVGGEPFPLSLFLELLGIALKIWDIMELVLTGPHH